MKALVLAEFGRMVVEVLPAPLPGPDEVLIEIAYTGICGSDIHGFTGANGRRVPGMVMGHETSGRVRAVGSEVSGMNEGAAVTLNPVVVPASDVADWRGREQQHPGKYVIGVKPDVVAAFAQLIVAPAGNVRPLPESMPLPHGALVEPLAVATHAVGRVNLPAGPVLVTGGGPIGQSIVVALIQAGVTRVVVSEPTAARRELLARLGATVIDPADGAVAEQVTTLLGRPAAAAFDAVGSSGSVADCLDSTVAGAAVVLVGMATPRLDLAAFELTGAERTLVGSFAYSSRDFDAALTRLGATPELADTMISHTVRLDDAPAAFTALAAGDGTPGKVLVALSE